MIYGYGNPGRQDDALGIKLTNQMEIWSEERKFQFLDFDSNYQLNIEDALLTSEYDLIIFADASTEEISHFSITRVMPNEKTEFSMHAISPAFVLHLCQKLYRRFPKVYLLHIKGFEFEFLGNLTKKAKENLELAVGFLTDILEKSAFPDDLLEDFVTDIEEVKIN